MNWRHVVDAILSLSLCRQLTVCIYNNTKSMLQSRASDSYIFRIAINKRTIVARLQFQCLYIDEHKQPHAYAHLHLNIYINIYIYKFCIYICGYIPHVHVHAINFYINYQQSKVVCVVVYLFIYLFNFFIFLRCFACILL